MIITQAELVQGASVAKPTSSVIADATLEDRIDNPLGFHETVVQFELSNYSFDIRCASGIMLINWTTGDETNVDGFRVHRRTLTDPVSNAWVNASTIIAKGSGNSYRTIDSKMEIGTSYLYRLYGFDENGHLSEALNYQLGPNVIPTCVYGNGAFAVQRSSTSKFSQVPVDMTIEQTVNRDSKTHG
ncbi:MAG: hypothetical protein AAF639_47495, partial [Chloroflexota bacterium]